MVEVERATDDVIVVFRELARDLDPVVRQALLVGIGYMKINAELSALVEELQRDDPDASVRRDAGVLLEALDARKPAPSALPVTRPTSSGNT